MCYLSRESAFKEAKSRGQSLNPKRQIRGNLQIWLENLSQGAQEKLNSNLKRIALGWNLNIAALCQEIFFSSEQLLLLNNNLKAILDKSLLSPKHSILFKRVAQACSYS